MNVEGDIEDFKDGFETPVADCGNKDLGDSQIDNVSVRGDIEHYENASDGHMGFKTWAI